MIFSSQGIAIGSLILFLTLPFAAISQTCTISGSGTINWTNPGPTCQEGGNAGGSTILIIPAGVTVNFDGNSDTWAGTRIEVNGTLTISAPGQVTINASVVVKNGGVLGISSKLNLGTTDGCGYTLIVESGGVVDIQGSTPDRLNICGNEIARGGSAGCNPYPTGPVPYCEPSGGFTGPTGFDEDGYNNVLPIELLYFKGHALNMTASIEWATVNEENFDYFQLERSIDGISFETLTEITGRGGVDIVTRYSYGDNLETSGRYYYRLKSVDYDRSFEYSKIISVLVGLEQSIVIYPNPVVDRKLNLKGLSGSVQCTLIDRLGRPLMNTELLHGQNEILINQDIPSGLYIMKVIGSGYSKTLKVQIL